VAEEKDTAEYRPIEDHPGYRVGNDGSVWSSWRCRGQGRGKPPVWFQSAEWKRLTPVLGKARRSFVSLGRGHSVAVARLVLTAFLGPCPDGYEACHFPDPDPANCSLVNLRWGTSAENTEDQRRHGTLVGGERHGMAKLSNAQVEEIRALAGTMTQAALGLRFGVTQPQISMILNGKSRTTSSHEGRGLYG
jgi:hypothetical protein